MKINWTRTGAVGMTTDGWMITRSPSGLGFLVFDDEGRYVGTYDTRRQAEQAAQAVTR